MVVDVVEEVSFDEVSCTTAARLLPQQVLPTISRKLLEKTLMQKGVGCSWRLVQLYPICPFIQEHKTDVSLKVHCSEDPLTAETWKTLKCSDAQTSLYKQC